MLIQEQKVESNQSQVVNDLEKQVYKWRPQLVENHGNTMKKE